MRHSALVAPIALSFFALVAACATAATDPIDENAQEQNGTAPPDKSSDGAKLPPPSSTGSTDSGAKQDSGGSTSSSSSGGSTSSSSSGGSTSSSSSGGSTSSSSGGVGPACDTSTPAKALIYQLKLSQEASPAPCPCPTTKCCYLGVACLDP